jgi:hypothetical protein
MRNEKLFWPLARPVTLIDPAQVPALHAKFAVQGAPMPDLSGRVQLAHPDEARLERMAESESDDESEEDGHCIYSGCES